jgi:hypothetical protein
LPQEPTHRLGLAARHAQGLVRRMGYVGGPASEQSSAVAGICRGYFREAPPWPAQKGRSVMDEDQKFKANQEKLLLKIKASFGFDTMLLVGVKTNPEDDDTESVYLINDRVVPESESILYLMRAIEVLLESLTDRPKIH